MSQKAEASPWTAFHNISIKIVMKTPNLPHRKNALFAACLLAGAAGVAQAQSINLSGDATPAGDMGGNLSTRIVVLGENGTGALTMSSGAVLNDTDGGFMGTQSGASGTATLSTNSTWTSQHIRVGDIGTGVLTIQSGAKLITRGLETSKNVGGKGSITVDGPNSALEVATASATRLTVGNADSGSLRVLNGGKVSSRHQFRTSEIPGSSSFVEVDGANSSVTADSCHLGGGGVSSIRINNAGLIDCQSTASLGYGNVSLAGADSKWTVGTDLYVGFEAGPADAVVNVGEGTALEVGASIRMAYANEARHLGPGTLNITGTTNPGSVTAPLVYFGQNGLGVINFNHTDASGNYVFTPSMVGPGNGTVNINDVGTTSFAGNNRYPGTTSVHAGVLRAGSATGLSGESDFVVDSGATLDTATFSPTIKSLSNAGAVDMTAGGANAVLTITGNYDSTGGSIALNTILGDSSSATEKLVVNGATSGNTILNISNLGGTGAPTTGEGILVVQVDGASNGTFSLPAPGYLEAGTFRYDLVKTGNNWYLVSESRAEASGPGVTVVCSPAELSDAVAETATCKVSLSAASTTDLSINLNVPGANPRYTTTCTSPLLIPANATEASCTITSVANNTPGDGDVTALLAVLPPTVADAYTVAGPAAQVVIKDKDQTDNGGGENPENPGGENPGGENPGGGTAPHKVPTMGAVGLATMASIMGWLGLRRTRQSRSSAKTA